MKQSTFLLSLLLCVTLIASSCQAIGDIFKAGAWTGIIIVVIVIAIIFWIIGKVRK